MLLNEFELANANNTETVPLHPRDASRAYSHKSHQQKRKELKLGKFFCQCLILKTNMNIFFFTLPYTGSHVGFGLSAIIMLIIFYINWYNHRSLCQLSNEIEQKDNIEINLYSDVIKIVYVDNPI